MGPYQNNYSRPRNRLLQVSNREHYHTQNSQYDINKKYQIFECNDKSKTASSYSYYAVVTPKTISVPILPNLHVPCRSLSNHIRSELQQSFPILTIQEDYQNRSYYDSQIFTIDPHNYILLNNQSLECKDSDIKIYIQTNILTIRKAGKVSKNTTTSNISPDENTSYFSKCINVVDETDNK